MTPYAGFLYFGVLLYVAVPAMIHGLLGQLRGGSRALLVVATIFMLIIQYPSAQTVWPDTSVLTLWLVAGYALTQWGIARGFLALRQRAKRRWLFYMAILLGLVPLAAARFVPLFASTARTARASSEIQMVNEPRCTKARS